MASVILQRDVCQAAAYGGRANVLPFAADSLARRGGLRVIPTVRLSLTVPSESRGSAVALRVPQGDPELAEWVEG